MNIGIRLFSDSLKTYLEHYGHYFNIEQYYFCVFYKCLSSPIPTHCQHVFLFNSCLQTSSTTRSSRVVSQQERRHINQLINQSIYLVFSQTWLRYVWLMLWQIRLSVVCLSSVGDIFAPHCSLAIRQLSAHLPKITKIVQGEHPLRANLPNRRVAVRLLQGSQINWKGVVKQANLAYRRLSYHKVTFGYLISWWVSCSTLQRQTFSVSIKDTHKLQSCR